MEAKQKRRVRKAEMLNSLTHGAGTLLALAAMASLLYLSLQAEPDRLKTISFMVYGISLILLFAASALYHGVQHPGIKPLLQKLDHAAIYLLIAGTYTPFTLVALKGAWGWWIFGIIWFLALAGVIFQLGFYRDRYRKVSTFIYLAMSWIIVVASGPLVRSLPAGGLFWVIAGGLLYSAGVFFYLRKKNPFNHVVWHLFVLGGAACHFIAIFLYLA